MISTSEPIIKQLLLPSEPKSLLSLESWVNSLCDAYEISVEIYGNILIALSEPLITPYLMVMAMFLKKIL